MAYALHTTHKYEKSVERCKRRGLPMEALKSVLLLLAQDGTLPPKYRPHKLSGKYAGCWECHIQPDWLLVWEPHDTELILLLVDTGTHSDLF